ncbi:hypothetical protein J2S58_002338 [Nakamurella flavida]|nr:hypothetical protein [Nakamurella flavida]
MTPAPLTRRAVRRVGGGVIGVGPGTRLPGLPADAADGVGPVSAVIRS